MKEPECNVEPRVTSIHRLIHDACDANATTGMGSRTYSYLNEVFLTLLALVASFTLASEVSPSLSPAQACRENPVRLACRSLLCEIRESGC